MSLSGLFIKSTSTACAHSLLQSLSLSCSCSSSLLSPHSSGGKTRVRNLYERPMWFYAGHRFQVQKVITICQKFYYQKMEEKHGSNILLPGKNWIRNLWSTMVHDLCDQRQGCSNLENGGTVLKRQVNPMHYFFPWTLYLITSALRFRISQHFKFHITCPYPVVLTLGYSHSSSFPRTLQI